MPSVSETTITESTAKVTAKKKRIPSQIKAQNRFVFFALTPIMIVFLVFSVIPIFWGLILSFFQYNPLQAHSPFIGLQNFTHLLHDDVFIKSFRNTFKFVFIAVPANIIFTLMIAIGINRIRSKFFRDLFRTIYFLPCIAPLAGSAVVWQTMFNKDTGLFNLVLNALHLPGVDWLTNPAIAMYSVIAMTLWADMGFNIVIFMAGLDSIPKMYYEAAELDGANRWKSFWNITVPLLSRTSLFVTVMTCLSYFQMFPQFQILTNGEPQNETRVLALNIYDHAFTYMDMGYASAIASVLFFIILIITMIQLKLGKSQWEY